MNVTALFLVWSIVMSLVTMMVYRVDKKAAIHGKQRVPERWLHGLELAGGWPGGLIAQRLFRHKTRKVRYQVVFWLIVAVHATAWIAWVRYRN